MAEVLGVAASVVTLVTLFKTCIEAFDVFCTIRDQTVDLKKLLLKLNIEKCRLYIWGQAMGLASSTKSGKKKALDLCPYPELVSETLELIVKLLGDSNKLKDKYGCKVMSDDIVANREEAGSVLRQLNASFDHFKVRPSSRIQPSKAMRKASWVIHDRSKFGALIQEAKALIDGLQDITRDLQTEATEQDLIISRIRRIDDVRTLDWISEVCEVDYPGLSDVASTEADSLTENRTLLSNVQDWKDRVRNEEVEEDSDSSSVRTTIAALEDMTVTELKQKFSAYLLQAREARLAARRDQSQEKPPGPSTGSDVSETTSGPLYGAGRGAKLEDDKIEIEHVINQQILDYMVEVNKDQDFMDEYGAIEQWFRVLSTAERAVTFYKLGDLLKSDSHMTRFFARVQNHRSDAIDSPGQPLKYSGLEALTSSKPV